MTAIPVRVTAVAATDRGLSASARMAVMTLTAARAAGGASRNASDVPDVDENDEAHGIQYEHIADYGKQSPLYAVGTAAIDDHVASDQLPGLAEDVMGGTMLMMLMGVVHGKHESFSFLNDGGNLYIIVM
uniref:Uncharacterized protein n=1 Tax=Cohnella candidum TaxID=2674991 RepID=A0A3G3JY44_9BACL|nr:hypothetical protein EAV92_11655 [Cohnella candidum]